MKELNKYIDHTILKPFAQEENIEKLCAEAKKYDFASVCINSSYIPLAKKLLEGTDVNICTVIGFPLGACATAVKVAETNWAYDNGCEEFDMVIHVGALKDKKYDYVRDDIKAVVEAAKGKCVKVIIETSLLTEEEKVMAVKLSCEAGACYVKTCTGFTDGIATVDDIKLMKANVTGGVKVKASSGIRTYDDAMALIEVGADRLGTSAGIAIVESKK